VPRLRDGEATMNRWDRIKLSWKLARGKLKLPPFMQSTAWGAGALGDVSDPSLYRNQALSYSRASAVYICVNRIAESGAMAAQTIAKGGPKAVVYDDKGEEVPDHPFLERLRQPNPLLSGFELLEASLGGAELTGNIYWYMHGVGNQVTREDAKTLRLFNPYKYDSEVARFMRQPLWIVPLRPDRMKPVPSKTDWLSHYEYRIYGLTYKLDAASVVHFRRYHPLKDFEGMSPVEPANYPIQNDWKAQRYNVAFWDNAARLSGIVESDADTMDPDQVKLMEKLFKENYVGDVDKMHQVAFLWSGFKWKEMGLSQKDAEFIEGRKMNWRDIAGIYGVNPALVYPEGANRATAQVAEYLFARYTMAPKLTRIAEKVNKDVMPLYGDGFTFAFVDVVPRDVVEDAAVKRDNATAVLQLVRALGAEQGLDEAKRQGLVTDEAEMGMPMLSTGGGLGGGMPPMKATPFPQELMGKGWQARVEAAREHVKAVEVLVG